MTGGVRRVEESRLSFLKGGKYNTKGSECWGFPGILVLAKEVLWACAEVAVVIGASRRSIVQGNRSATQGNLLFLGV